MTFLGPHKKAHNRVIYISGLDICESHISRQAEAHTPHILVGCDRSYEMKAR
jgi:hypothetical protein